MLTAPKKKSDREPAPIGNHRARLYQLIHIGTTHFNFEGQAKSSDKIRLTFELSDELRPFGEDEVMKPLAISREFGLSMGKKSYLRPFVENLTGSKFTDDEAYAFDIETLLGSACLLNVVHIVKKGNTYEDIAGASPLPKGMEAAPQFNESKYIDVNSSPIEEIESLPEFLRNKIYESDEWTLRQQATENVSLAKANRPGFVNPGDIELDPNDVPF